VGASAAQPLDPKSSEDNNALEPLASSVRDLHWVFSKQGQLDAAQAIASSLTVTPSDAGNYHWAQEVEVRPLAPAIL
jgi:hypothetical protein